MKKQSDEKEILVSDKHLGLRIAAFAVAFVVAVSAFAVGIYQMVKKEPGYAVITPAIDKDAPRYASGITLTYYFSGSSGEIKDAQRELTTHYSGALQRIYKLLDPVEEYPGFVNLATINHHPGKELEVSEELFAVLTDALDKTAENQGFNLFAGPLNAEWNSILGSEQAADFDPLNDPEEAARLAAIAEMTADRTCVSLTVTDANRRAVRLDLSDRYTAFSQQYELTGPVLDLGLLKEAWILDLTAADLEKGFYHFGYFQTADGLVRALSQPGGGDNVLYAWIENAPATAALAPMKENMACSRFKCFPLGGELGYYTVEAQGQVHYRGPYSLAAPAFETPLAASYAMTDGSAVEACYHNIRLWHLGGMEAILAAVAEERDCLLAVVAPESRVLYGNRLALAQIETYAGAGFSVRPAGE
ncbi:MAG: hypothetical protein IK141_07965 [Clostridia bacterium]|nr:hypothetical protein [Clostridia bacterium]